MLKILKPNKIKIAIFIALIIVSLVILWAARIFPCKTRSIPLIEFKEGLCTSAALTGKIIPIFIGLGVQTVYPPISYLIYFVLVLFLPYILSCILMEFLRKKSRNKTFKRRQKVL